MSVAAAIVLGFSGAAVGAGPAAASVTQSCAWWKNIGNIKGVPIYHGNICGGLSRDGLVIKELRYAWNSYSKTCNWWVDFDFFDGTKTGGPYYRSQGAQTTGCSNSGHGRRSGGMPILARTGQMCVSIFTNRTGQIDRLVRTCQNI